MKLPQFHERQICFFPRNLLQERKELVPRILRVVPQAWRVNALTGALNILLFPYVPMHERVQIFEVLGIAECVPILYGGPASAQQMRDELHGEARLLRRVFDHIQTRREGRD